MEVIDQAKSLMSSAIEHLKDELKGIRTSRANPAMLDPVSVEVYGTKMRLRDVATISSPEPRMLLISPFDVQNAHAIAKGVEKANIGLQPVVDGNVVRITVPEMDTSTRQDMVKIARRKCEDAKVSVRNARRECNDTIRKQKNEGDISEDNQKNLEKRIQEQTDKFCKEADQLAQSKEQEILTV